MVIVSKVSNRAYIRHIITIKPVITNFNWTWLQNFTLRSFDELKK